MFADMMRQESTGKLAAVISPCHNSQDDPSATNLSLLLIVPGGPIGSRPLLRTSGCAASLQQCFKHNAVQSTTLKNTKSQRWTFR